MKKIYWRPRAISRTALMIIALFSVGGLWFVEFHRSEIEQPHRRDKVKAAALAAHWLEVIKDVRVNQLKIPIDKHVDPAESGLIGEAMSTATSVPGVLSAKRTAVNPNFAAVVVDMLKKAGVKKDDTVAVSYSGSFPALNICVCAAIQTLGAKPISISSAAASQWGANYPNFLWLDMERLLAERTEADEIERRDKEKPTTRTGATTKKSPKLTTTRFLHRSLAASIGGVEDRGLGMSKETQATLREGIRRSGLPEIEADMSDETEGGFTASVERRFQFYKEKAGEARIQVYINVGGGTSSVGKKVGKKLLHAGLNTSIPLRARNIESVMTRFLKEEVPVIHLVRIKDLARQYGLAVNPDHIPDDGKGEPYDRLYVRHEYNPVYAGGLLVMLLVSLYAFIRSDWGFRLFQNAGSRRKESGHPEPMV